MAPRVAPRALEEVRLFEALAPALGSSAAAFAAQYRDPGSAEACEETLRLRGYALGVLTRELGADLLGDRHEPEAVRALIALAVEALAARGVSVALEGRPPRIRAAPGAWRAASLCARLLVLAAEGTPRLRARFAPLEPGVAFLVEGGPPVAIDSSAGAVPLAAGAWAGIGLPARWLEGFA